MQKRQILFLAACFFFTHSYAYSLESNKLVGNIIGTMDSFNYESFQCSATVNAKENAFDGDLTTIFATCQRAGGWVGLDLGEKHVITKVSFCPRADEPGPRMLLGVFEGANNPDFGDAIPIYMITEAPAKNVLTEKTVDCSRGFRYVRYVGPDDVRCNLAELEFYGYKSDGDDSKLAQLTNLPNVIIHTTNAEDVSSRENYLKGIVSIISEDGTQLFTDSLEIRGRGNASWGFPKKPYRMRLFNKASLVGHPATERNWTLINNYGDKTLMRNLLAFDLSSRYELVYTPAGTPVNVFLNGEFKGCYQLCDHIQVAENRVGITEMKKGDISGEALTGGYLIEVDAYADTEDFWFTSNRNAIPVTIKSPDKDENNTAQRDYIANYFNAFEAAVYSSNYKDPETGYRKYLDTSSFIRHFLVGEISGNTDTYWSTYMYKQRGIEKLFTGPVWDFDLAYENDHRTYPINDNSNWLFLRGSYAGSRNTGMRGVVERILSDETFMTELKETYAHYRDRGTITEATLVKVIDDYEEMMNESQRLNFVRWPIMNSSVHMNPRVYGSYAAEVENVRNYVRGRIAWMDNKLSYVPAASSTAENKLSKPVIWTEGNTVYVDRLASGSFVRIADVSGQIIFAENVNSTLRTVLSQGVYIISVKNEGEEWKSEKVIIH